MIGLNPFLDSLCNFGFKNGGLHSGGYIEGFPGPQDVVKHCMGILEMDFERKLENTQINCVSI